MKRPRVAAAEIAKQEALKVPGLAARDAAGAILRDVIVGGHALDDIFAARAGLSRLDGVALRDVALTRAIVSAALRRLGTIRNALTSLLEDGFPRTAPQIEWILIVAAVQILFLDVPDHAAVDLAVRITRLDTKTAPFAALVNGVARNLARQRDAFLATSAPLDVDTPAWLALRWRKTYGEATATAIAAAHGLEPTLDLTVKNDTAKWATELDAVQMPTGSLRLRTHQPIQDLPGFSGGAWWVQDAAAALPAMLFKAAPDMHIGDLCAAPGGKTAQLVARGARVTAIDRSAERLKILAANLERLHLQAEIVVAEVTSLNGVSFDAVLLDAPCSGTGTIRRHPDIAWTKKSGDIAKLTILQARMLDKAFELVKPGGTIVYCVCSIEPEEGEQQIAHLLRRNPDISRLPITAEEVGGVADFINAQGDIRTLPSHMPAEEPRLSGVDGFFAARLMRRA